MFNKLVSSTLAAVALSCGLAGVSQAYPTERPGPVRMQYEAYYFPVRVVNMAAAVLWDVPTGSFQDSIKGAIGGTKMVARNLGNESSPYTLIAGGLTGGPVGAVGGAVYGLLHGFAYGADHGFMGYASDDGDPTSHTKLFRAKQFIVPYDDDY